MGLIHFLLQDRITTGSNYFEIFLGFLQLCCLTAAALNCEDFDIRI